MHDLDELTTKKMKRVQVVVKTSDKRRKELPPGAKHQRFNIYSDHEIGLDCDIITDNLVSSVSISKTITMRIRSKTKTTRLTMRYS